MKIVCDSRSEKPDFEHPAMPHDACRNARLPDPGPALLISTLAENTFPLLYLWTAPQYGHDSSQSAQDLSGGIAPTTSLKSSTSAILPISIFPRHPGDLHFTTHQCSSFCLVTAIFLLRIHAEFSFILDARYDPFLWKGGTLSRSMRRYVVSADSKILTLLSFCQSNRLAGMGGKQ